MIGDITAAVLHVLGYTVATPGGAALCACCCILGGVQAIRYLTGGDRL